jgi:hypothetical protein
LNIGARQGDQMSLRKIAQNVAQSIFLSELKQSIYLGKSSPILGLLLKFSNKTCVKLKIAQ